MKFEAMYDEKTITLDISGLPIFKEMNRVVRLPDCRNALASMLLKYGDFKIFI